MSRRVRIDPRIHARNEKYTHEMAEYGGTMDLNPTTGLIDHRTVSSDGVYNNVKVPEGLVQFHTHPRDCQRTVCTMGVPSIEDLLGFANAVIRGDTLVHVLYSREGPYVLMLQPEVRRMLQSNTTQLLPAWLDIVEEELAAYKIAHPVTKSTYDEWRHGWIQKARSEGFDIQHWRGGVPPVLHLYSDALDTQTTACDDLGTYKTRQPVQKNRVTQWALGQLGERCTTPYYY